MDFATAVSDFLDGVSIVFPECKLILDMKTSWLFLTEEQRNQYALDILVDKQNNLWTQLKIHEKLDDKTITDDSKTAIISHLNNITEAAKEIHSELKPENEFSFLSGFTDLLMKLLTYVSDLFPECTSTSGVLLLAKGSLGSESVVNALSEWMRRKLINSWMSNIVPCDSEIRKGNMEGVFSTDITLVRPLDLRSKWEDKRLTQEMKDQIVSLIIEMNMMAQYNAIIPEEMIKPIEKFASLLASNNGDAPNMDTMDMVKNMCDSIYQKSSNDSNQELMNSIPKLQELCLQNMQHTLSKQ